MKYTKKQIEGILKSKVRHWVSTSLSFASDLKEKDIIDHYIITGGSIVSLLLDEEPKDYDIYFDDVMVCKKVVEQYLPLHILKAHELNLHGGKTPKGKWIRESFPGYLEIEEPINTQKKKKNYNAYYGQPVTMTPINGKYDVVSVTSNSVTLTNGIQIITKTCGSPMEIHESFDFIHCVSYYTPETGLVLNRHAMESILTKELKYIGSVYPVCSLFRMKKFLARGWTISEPEMLKIIMDIMGIPTTKLAMEHQLQYGLNSKWETFIENLPDDFSELNRNELNALCDAA